MFSKKERNPDSVSVSSTAEETSKDRLLTCSHLRLVSVMKQEMELRLFSPFFGRWSQSCDSDRRPLYSVFMMITWCRRVHMNHKTSKGIPERAVRALLDCFLLKFRHPLSALSLCTEIQPFPSWDKLSTYRSLLTAHNRTY